MNTSVLVRISHGIVVLGAVIAAAKPPLDFTDPQFISALVVAFVVAVRDSTDKVPGMKK